MVVFLSYLNTDRTLTILFNNFAIKIIKEAFYRCIKTLTIIAKIGLERDECQEC